MFVFAILLVVAYVLVAINGTSVAPSAETMATTFLNDETISTIALASLTSAPSETRTTRYPIGLEGLETMSSTAVTADSMAFKSTSEPTTVAPTTSITETRIDNNIYGFAMCSFDDKFRLRTVPMNALIRSVANCHTGGEMDNANCISYIIDFSVGCGLCFSPMLVCRDDFCEIECVGESVSYGCVSCIRFQCSNIYWHCLDINVDTMTTTTVPSRQGNCSDEDLQVFYRFSNQQLTSLLGTCRRLEGESNAVHCAESEHGISNRCGSCLIEYGACADRHCADVCDLSTAGGLLGDKCIECTNDNCATDFTRCTGMLHNPFQPHFTQISSYSRGNTIIRLSWITMLLSTILFNNQISMT